MNLLRASNINPKLSAEAQLNGNFDYNITPLASSGNAVVVHEKLIQRGSRSVHGAIGWYLGPFPNHYRCFELYITKTGQTRIVDSAEFYPAKYKMLTLSTIVIAVKTAFELMEALQNMTHPTKLQLKNNELKEMQKFSTIFTDIATSKVFESMRDNQLPRVEKYSWIIARKKITLQIVNFRGWKRR